MQENHTEIKFLAANWPAPPHIHAGTTLRTGGVSKPPYDQLNLGMHVNDEQSCVLANRERLAEDLKLPAEPVWLNQGHGNNIIHLDSTNNSETTVNNVDGSYSTEADKVCVVMTADCLPLLMCDAKGQQVAAVHVGWRGFSKNIITVALEKFTCPNEEILAWLGPCICAKHYETGMEVHDACLSIFSKAKQAFSPTRPQHWQTDLHKLVSLYLQEQGLNKIYGEQRCTYHENGSFFSYRKNKDTGRMASLIWIDNSKESTLN